MTSGSAPTPKDVCDRFAELMRKAGKGGRKIEKKARRCRDRLPSLRNEQPTEFECVTSCAMAADTLAAFDACDERCGSPSNDAADAH